MDGQRLGGAAEERPRLRSPAPAARRRAGRPGRPRPTHSIAKGKAGRMYLIPFCALPRLITSDEQQGEGQDRGVHGDLAAGRRRSRPRREPQAGQDLGAHRRLQGQGRQVEPPPTVEAHLAEQVTEMAAGAVQDLGQEPLEPVVERQGSDDRGVGEARLVAAEHGGVDVTGPEAVDRPQRQHEGAGQRRPARQQRAGPGLSPTATAARHGPRAGRRSHGQEAQRRGLGGGGQGEDAPQNRRP